MTSIASNVADGFGRGTDADEPRFRDLADRVTEVERMLASLIPDADG